jgi:hypothetical protein
MEKRGIMKRGPAVSSVGNRPRMQSERGHKTMYCTTLISRMAEMLLAESFHLWSFLKGRCIVQNLLTLLRAVRRYNWFWKYCTNEKYIEFFKLNPVFRNVTKEIKRIIYLYRFMLSVHTGTYWFWEPREFLNTYLPRHVPYRLICWQTIICVSGSTKDPTGNKRTYVL